MPFIREDQANIQVSRLANNAWRPLFGPWKSAEGATLEASDAKTRPGNMGKQVALGGPAERDDVTCQIQLTDVVLNMHKTLEADTGRRRYKVSYTFLDPDGLPTGPSHTVVGVMKSPKLPNMDSEASDAALYTIVVSLDEQAA